MKKLSEIFLKDLYVPEWEIFAGIWIYIIFVPFYFKLSYFFPIFFLLIFVYLYFLYITADVRCGIRKVSKYISKAKVINSIFDPYIDFLLFFIFTFECIFIFSSGKMKLLEAVGIFILIFLVLRGYVEITLYISFLRGGKIENAIYFPRIFDFLGVFSGSLIFYYMVFTSKKMAFQHIMLFPPILFLLTHLFFILYLRESKKRGIKKDLKYKEIKKEVRKANFTYWNSVKKYSFLFMLIPISLGIVLKLNGSCCEVHTFIFYLNFFLFFYLTIFYKNRICRGLEITMKRVRKLKKDSWNSDNFIELIIISYLANFINSIRNYAFVINVLLYFLLLSFMLSFAYTILKILDKKIANWTFIPLIFYFFPLFLFFNELKINIIYGLFLCIAPIFPIFQFSLYKLKVFREKKGIYDNKIKSE